MWGTIVNAAAVVAGTAIGLLVKKGIPERLNKALMNGLALCTLFIGITGVLDVQNAMVVVVSMVLGTVIGSLIDLDRQVRRLGDALQRRIKGSSTQVSEGIMASTLMFCAGAMTVMGCIQSGIQGDHTILYTKSLLDIVTAVMFTAAYGYAVGFSAIGVLVYQGGLTLLAMAAAPLLNDVVAAEMGCIGSILLIGLGLNMLKVTELKIMNHLPAIFLPILIYLIV